MDGTAISQQPSNGTDVLRERVAAVDGVRAVAERAAADALGRYAPEAQASALRAALLEESEITPTVRELS